MEPTPGYRGTKVCEFLVLKVVKSLKMVGELEIVKGIYPEKNTPSRNNFQE